jgi:uncharacterized protein (DUF2249 family)
MAAAMPEVREIDVRWLEPPEPFERIVGALTTLAPGERLKVLIHREPLPLFAMLRDNGYEYTAARRADGMFELCIWEPAA